MDHCLSMKTAEVKSNELSSYTIVWYVIVKAGKECCKRYSGTMAGVKRVIIQQEA